MANVIQTEQPAALRQRPAKRRRKRPYPGRPACRHSLEAPPAPAALRAAKIARARQLLAQANYPPPEIIQVLAEILAQKGARFWLDR